MISIDEKIKTLRDIFNIDSEFFYGSQVSFVSQMIEKLEQDGTLVDNISSNQEEYIDSIYEKSKTALEDTQKFLNKLEEDKDFKERFEKCLFYYSFITDEPYYGANDIRNKYRNYLKSGDKQNSFVITNKHIHKMFNNKFFLKAYSAYKAAPLYKEGQIVSLRQNGDIVRPDGKFNKDLYRFRHYSFAKGYNKSDADAVVKYRNILNYGLLKNHNAREIVNYAKNFPLYILKVDPMFPVSSAKGAKLYTVVTISPKPTTFTVEERHLKNFKG